MELDSLYQDVILDHFRNPRCKGALDNPDASVRLVNPLCGDEIKLTVGIKDGRICDVACEGHGCAISQASASMMSELLKGKTLEEVRARVELFKQVLEGKSVPDIEEKLGDAAALEGVKNFAARIKCAVLAWEAMETCLTEVNKASK